MPQEMAEYFWLATMTALECDAIAAFLPDAVTPPVRELVLRMSGAMATA